MKAKNVIPLGVNTRRQRRVLVLRSIALSAVLLVAFNVMMTLRINVVGENGSTMAIYSMGALFVLAPAIAIFCGTQSPERYALKWAIAAVVVVGVWFAIEEKLILTYQEYQCQQVDCDTWFYTRHPLMADSVDIEYRAQWGQWRVVD